MVILRKFCFLFALLCAEVLALLLCCHWILWGVFVGLLCFIFPAPEQDPITEVLGKHLHPGDPACLGYENSGTMTAGAWLSQNHCKLEIGVFHIRISCTLVLGRITFIFLLPAQLCSVAALRAMGRWNSGKIIHTIHYLWNSCSSLEVLVTLPFVDF